MKVKNRNKKFPKAVKLLMPHRNLNWHQIWILSLDRYKRKMKHPVLKTLNIVLWIVSIVYTIYYLRGCV